MLRMSRVFGQCKWLRGVGRNLSASASAGTSKLNKSLLPDRAADDKRLFIVLDMDECLIHCAVPDHGRKLVRTSLHVVLSVDVDVILLDPWQNHSRRTRPGNHR